jgi:hypothetical protein
MESVDRDIEDSIPTNVDDKTMIALARTRMIRRFRKFRCLYVRPVSASKWKHGKNKPRKNDKVAKPTVCNKPCDSSGYCKNHKPWKPRIKSMLLYGNERKNAIIASSVKTNTKGFANTVKGVMAAMIKRTSSMIQRIEALENDRDRFKSVIDKQQTKIDKQQKEIEELKSLSKRKKSK